MSSFNRIGVIWSSSHHMWFDLYFLVTCILIAVTMMIFVSARVESAAVILGSSLEANNPDAMPSLVTAFVGIGSYLLAMLLCGISGLFGQTK